MSVWQRIKGWFRRKPAEVVPIREEFEPFVASLPDFRVPVMLAAEPDVLRWGSEPLRPSAGDPPDPEPAAQFIPPTCSCCKCQPSIYRTYGDGTVLCVECAG